MLITPFSLKKEKGDLIAWTMRDALRIKKPRRDVRRGFSFCTRISLIHVDHADSDPGMMGTRITLIDAPACRSVSGTQAGITRMVL